MSRYGIVRFNRLVFESARFARRRQRLFFFKLRNLGGVGLWFRRQGLWVFLVKTFGWIDSLTLRDNGFFRHGNACGTDEIHFCATEFAADSAPTLAVTLKIRNAKNRPEEQDVKDYGATDVFLEGEFVRDGECGGHVMECAHAP